MTQTRTLRRIWSHRTKILLTIFGVTVFAYGFQAGSFVITVAGGSLMGLGVGQLIQYWGTHEVRS